MAKIFRENIRKMKLNSKYFSNEEKVKVHKLITDIFHTPVTDAELQGDINRRFLIEYEKK